MQPYEVLSQPWGGLGDSLLYTNLPRLYSEQQIDVYLSKVNYSRNQDIEDLCWLSNKYLRKSKKLIPTIGYKVALLNNFKVENEDFNAIQNANHIHNFEAGDGFPEIFIDKNKYQTSSKHSLVLDLGGNSLFSKEAGGAVYNFTSFNNVISEFSNSKTLELTYPNLYSNQLFNSIHTEKKINNIPQLIDLLTNTDVFVCLNSGSHVLAASLNNLTGYPKKIISFNSVSDPNKIIRNGNILNKNGRYYFDNVYYQKIDVENNLNVKTFNQHPLNRMKKYIYIHKLILQPQKTLKETFLRRFFILIKKIKNLS